MGKRLTKEEFLKGYGNFIARLFGDDGFRAQVEQDLPSALKDAGLDVSGSKSVLLLPAEHAKDVLADAHIQSTDPNDFCYELWQQGVESGEYRIIIPELDQSLEGELTDEELMAVAGGGDGITVLTINWNCGASGSGGSWICWNSPPPHAA